MFRRDAGGLSRSYPNTLRNHSRSEAARNTSNDAQVMYRMHLDANRIVVKVEKEKKVKSKVVWEEVKQRV